MVRDVRISDDTFWLRMALRSRVQQENKEIINVGGVAHSASTIASVWIDLVLQTPVYVSAWDKLNETPPEKYDGANETNKRRLEERRDPTWNLTGDPEQMISLFAMPHDKNGQLVNYLCEQLTLYLEKNPQRSTEHCVVVVFGRSIQVFGNRRLFGDWTEVEQRLSSATVPLGEADLQCQVFAHCLRKRHCVVMSKDQDFVPLLLWSADTSRRNQESDLGALVWHNLCHDCFVDIRALLHALCSPPSSSSALALLFFCLLSGTDFCPKTTPFKRQIMHKFLRSRLTRMPSSDTDLWQAVCRQTAATYTNWFNGNGIHPFEYIFRVHLAFCYGEETLVPCTDILQWLKEVEPKWSVMWQRFAWNANYWTALVSPLWSHFDPHLVQPYTPREYFANPRVPPSRKRRREVSSTTSPQPVSFVTALNTLSWETLPPRLFRKPRTYRLSPSKWIKPTLSCYPTLETKNKRL